MLDRLLINLPRVVLLLIALAAQVQLILWLFRSPASQRSTALRKAAWIAGAALCVWIALGFVFSVPRFSRMAPNTSWFYWFRGIALSWALAALGAFVISLLWRRLPRFQPERRGFLRTAGTAVAGLPFAAVGFGILVERLNIQVREIEAPIENLPRDLDGLRLVQLSDIHLSPFLEEQDLARAVDMANELRGDVALVTGDLITTRYDPLEAALRQVARLKAEAGIVGCHGNHEVYARCQERATREGARLGIRFLRQQAEPLRFGDAVLNIAGTDYQRINRLYLKGAERLLVPGAVNVLLQHNPDVFPVAAAQGWQLTLAGHTHGGQVTVEILSQTLNLARFWTPYVYGLYREGAASIYVTRGIGTVGIPARIGAPPEIALIRLVGRPSGPPPALSRLRT